jgi:hypothetical protein
MIKLIQLSKIEFLVVCPAHGVYFKGTLNLAKKVLRDLYVEDVEIQYALDEFKSKGDDYADFGVNRMVTFTSNMAKSKEVAA